MTEDRTHAAARARPVSVVPLDAALHVVVLGAALAVLGNTMHTWLVIVCSPWLEEIVFRLGLQDALQRCLPRLGGAVPVILTAIAFGAAHAVLNPGPWAWATALPALPIGAVYRRLGRLAPCALLHAAFNLIWFAGGPNLALPN